MGGSGPEEPGRPQAEVERRLRERLGRELDSLIEAEIQAFGGLIDRGTAVLLIASREGILEPRITPLSEASGTPVTLKVVVRGVRERKSVLLVDVEDGSASGTLILEGGDAVAAKLMGLSPNRRILLVGVEVSRWRGVIRIRLGKWGMIRYLD